VGNVTDKTNVTFEYDIKPANKLKELNVDIKNTKELPFQAQIYYTTPKGHRMVRICTRT